MSWMKPLAPRKHTNIEAPKAPTSKAKAPAPMSTAKEVALGVLTPALSDLAVLSRVDAILDEDRRSPDEVRRRWAHLEPIVQAFEARLASLELEELSAEAPEPEPELSAPADVPPPPDPGDLSLSPQG